MSDPTTTPNHAASAQAGQLHRVAANLRWNWHRATADLLATLPEADPAVHPVTTLRRLESTGPGRVALAAWLEANAGALAPLAAEVAELESSIASPEIAYFCPEFGIAAQLPQYSGGLGILAGDHLKSASDIGLPLVAVGLFYRKGFFRQEIVDGAQSERIEPVDPLDVGAHDTGVQVTVSVQGHLVALRVWELWVGATRLLMLDSDVEANPVWARAITDQLYAGDRRHRLSQELVLGAGGVRALRALGLAPLAFHLNEGHACFLLLELLAEHIEAGATMDAATAAVRASTLFTTHTPVPAGIDRFDQPMVRPELAPWAARLGVTDDEILAWACLPTDGPDQPFNTAALAFHLCGRVNGVSQLHATVSRQLFGSLPAAARVEGITNGVHGRTWVEPMLQALYDRDLGPGWENGDPEAWANVTRLDRESFDQIRAASRARLIDLVYGLTGTQLDPGACILGFARRFATYKRASLLLHDPDGLKASLAAGAQFVFAGKAHPADGEGKAVLAEVARFARQHGGNQIVIVPDYDIDIARAMYAGVDVWLNNPIRPHEACGTSGEKAALNGVLNCSIADGWWADWYTDGIGWVIPTSDATDEAERDREEAAALHAVLNNDVLRLFNGTADGWWSVVTSMLRHLGPLVTAGRMVAEYDRRFYTPILSGPIGSGAARVAAGS